MATRLPHTVRIAGVQLAQLAADVPPYSVHQRYRDEVGLRDDDHSAVVVKHIERLTESHDRGDRSRCVVDFEALTADLVGFVRLLNLMHRRRTGRSGWSDEVHLVTPSHESRSERVDRSAHSIRARRTDGLPRRSQKRDDEFWWLLKRRISGTGDHCIPLPAATPPRRAIANPSKPLAIRAIPIQLAAIHISRFENETRELSLPGGAWKRFGSSRSNPSRATPAVKASTALTAPNAKASTVSERRPRMRPPAPRREVRTQPVTSKNPRRVFTACTSSGPRSQGGRQSDELSCAWRNPGSVLARFLSEVAGLGPGSPGRSSEQGPHSAVAISTWSTPRHGPCFLISSVLLRPLIVSARELSNDEPTAPTEGRDPLLARRSMAEEVYWAS